MVKRLSRRGQQTILPIVGDTLVEVRLSTCLLPALVFKASDGSEAELRLEERVRLSRGDSERVLEGSKSGSSFDPKGLAPLLELLGSEVQDAIAQKDGGLRLVFSNALILEIATIGPGEAWHFSYPRPGRPPGGELRGGLSVTGFPGGLG